jgi:hypothetical protein
MALMDYLSELREGRMAKLVGAADGGHPAVAALTEARTTCPVNSEAIS